MMATLMTVIMFSLAGIPPLAGFWGKWYVFLAAINAELYALAIIGVLASVVGAYYYLRIIKIMWFDKPWRPSSRWPANCALCLASRASSCSSMCWWADRSRRSPRRRPVLLLTRRDGISRSRRAPSSRDTVSKSSMRSAPPMPRRWSGGMGVSPVRPGS
jgi:hypothetical protein